MLVKMMAMVFLLPDYFFLNKTKKDKNLPIFFLDTATNKANGFIKEGTHGSGFLLY